MLELGETDTMVTSFDVVIIIAICTAADEDFLVDDALLSEVANYLLILSQQRFLFLKLVSISLCKNMNNPWWHFKIFINERGVFYI